MSPQATHRDTAPPKRRVSYRDLPAKAARFEAPAVEVRQRLGLGYHETLPHEKALGPHSEPIGSPTKQASSRPALHRPCTYWRLQ